ncbi:hypothetical protein AB9K21_04830 [Anaplasma phagocytophilum]|uniref:Uncharacterized protein n=1 Tax=Anaplasma phagocytophilum str. ApNP TaxID=1359153 RepID=A0A0F3NGZ5_ANAPH|nr:hypothetical protein APHNP_1146 [Anaplasma phagocytophilum str. ApNP]
MVFSSVVSFVRSPATALALSLVLGASLYGPVARAFDEGQSGLHLLASWP